MPARTKKHPCFAAQCNCQCQAGYLMCRKHWFCVPTKLRDLIWETVAEPDRREEYERAVVGACIAVAKREGLGPEAVAARLMMQETPIQATISF